MSFQVTDALLHAYATNDRINAFPIKNVPDEAWRANPPGGKGRDIASIAAHVQALEKSFAAVQDVLRASLNGDGRVKGFRPDAGSFLARQLGHPISQSAMYGLWEWGTRGSKVN